MIRIGIVGCGRILAAHLRGYQRLREAGVDDFRITALCARREDDARMYLQRGQGPPQRQPVSDAPGDPLAVGDIYLSDFQDDVDVAVYTDYRQMIAEGPIDAVNDFTIHSLHHQIAAVAFDHGKHLLTQKPLAITVAAGRQMCEQAEAKDLVLAVFENARNRPDTRHLHWLFDSGHGGRLQLMLMTNVGNWWAPDRIVAETPWRHQLSQGGGITLDIGVHLFNHFRCIAGEVTHVTGHTSVLQPQRTTRDATGKTIEQIDCDADDTMLATFQTESGAVGNLCASWAGQGGGLRFGTARGIVYYGSGGNVQDQTFTSSDGNSHDLAELYQEHCPAPQQAAHFPLGLTDGFALNQYDWLAAIREHREPETSGHEGLRDLATSLAVLESSHAGRPVEVQEVLDGSLSAFQKPLNEKFGLR